MSTGEGARKAPVCRPPFLISNCTLYVQALKFYWLSNGSWVLHKQDNSVSYFVSITLPGKSKKKAEQKLRFCLCNSWKLYSCNILNSYFYLRCLNFKSFFFLVGYINGIVNVCFQDMMQNVFHKQLLKCERLSVWIAYFIQVQYVNTV